MTEQSLSKLFQRLRSDGRSIGADLLDADTLVAASSGTLSGDRRDEVAATLSRSPLQTDLVRMLHELAGDSATVANAVNARESLAHSRNGRRVRHAGDARRQASPLRWAGLAACLMLAFGMIVWHPLSQHSAGSVASEASKPDRIFTSQDRIFSMTDAPVTHSATDGVFHSDFNDG
ncbi:MAG: hypothetical protein ABIR27_10010 [Dokdonella sp.]